MRFNGECRRVTMQRVGMSALEDEVMSTTQAKKRNGSVKRGPDDAAEAGGDAITSTRIHSRRQSMEINCSTTTGIDTAVPQLRMRAAAAILFCRVVSRHL